jgi:hypothetical protein
MLDSYTFRMNPLRTLALFDSGAQPASWNERMSPGEYAVHYSSFDSSAPGTGPSCTILGSLAEAEEYARPQVALKPALRCRIYDHEGFVGPPFSKFADGNMWESVRSHHASADCSAPCCSRWSGIVHRGLECGFQAYMARDYRRAHAYSGSYFAGNRSDPGTARQA